MNYLLCCQGSVLRVFVVTDGGDDTAHLLSYDSRGDSFL